MTSLAFEVRYSHKGQGSRVLLGADEVELALQRFPGDLEHRLFPGSSVLVRSTTKAAIVVVVDSPAGANEIKRAVAESLDSFQLYAKPSASLPP